MPAGHLNINLLYILRYLTIVSDFSKFYFEIEKHEKTLCKYAYTTKYIDKCISKFLNPLTANPEKWSNTLKQIVGNLPTICLSVFDHFINLVLKGLTTFLLKDLLVVLANV